MQKPPPLTRVGAVLVFREGVTKEQAEQLLDHLRQHLWPVYHSEADGTPRGFHVEEFDANWGEPVFYIP